MLFAAAIALFAAAAQAQALPPVCALNCINAQLASQNCASFSDYACVCSDTFRALAIPCVFNACSSSDLALAASTTNTICQNYFNGLYGPVSRAGAAPGAPGAGGAVAGGAGSMMAGGDSMMGPAGSNMPPSATVTLAPAGPGGAGVNPNMAVRTVTVTVERCGAGGGVAPAPAPGPGAPAPAPNASMQPMSGMASGSAAATGSGAGTPPRVTLPAFTPPPVGQSGAQQIGSFGALALGLLAIL